MTTPMEGKGRHLWFFEACVFCMTEDHITDKCPRKCQCGGWHVQEDHQCQICGDPVHFIKDCPQLCPCLKGLCKCGSKLYDIKHDHTKVPHGFKPLHSRDDHVCIYCGVKGYNHSEEGCTYKCTRCCKKHHISYCCDILWNKRL